VDMVCSMHPHGISQDERTCLYFQTRGTCRKSAGAGGRLRVGFPDPRAVAAAATASNLGAASAAATASKEEAAWQ